MQSFSVVLLQHDSAILQSLAACFARIHSSVHVVHSVDELQRQVVKHRAPAAILDLEAASIAEIEALAREFPAVRFVCNHRLADDGMWTAVLSVGGADCLHSHDTRGIVSAAVGDAGLAASAAA
jgi:hypothetical protein